jgi:hypothetical protein
MNLGEALARKGVRVALGLLVAVVAGGSIYLRRTSSWDVLFAGAVAILAYGIFTREFRKNLEQRQGQRNLPEEAQEHPLLDDRKFNRKRLVVGIALVMTLLVTGVHLFDLGLFGRYSRQLMIVSFAVLAAVMHFFGPSVSEVRQYRDKKSHAQG